MKEILTIVNVSSCFDLVCDKCLYICEIEILRMSYIFDELVLQKNVELLYICISSKLNIYQSERIYCIFCIFLKWLQQNLDFNQPPPNSCLICVMHILSLFTLIRLHIFDIYEKKYYIKF